VGLERPAGRGLCGRAVYEALEPFQEGKGGRLRSVARRIDVIPIAGEGRDETGLGIPGT
jgi:hypothetical protein